MSLSVLTAGFPAIRLWLPEADPLFIRHLHNLFITILLPIRYFKCHGRTTLIILISVKFRIDFWVAVCYSIPVTN